MCTTERFMILLILVLKVLQANSQSTVAESTCDDKLSLLSQRLVEIKDDIVDTLEQSIRKELNAQLSTIKCSSAESRPRMSCDRGWTKINNSCYHEPLAEKRRNAASAYCRDVMRGQLVTFKDQAEMQLVRAAFAGSLWVGAVKNDVGEWVWEECGESDTVEGGWSCEAVPVAGDLWHTEGEPGSSDVFAFLPTSTPMQGITGGSPELSFVCEYEMK